MNNRLQIVRTSQLFTTRQAAIDYIQLNRSSIDGEPILAKYGIATDPNIILGIGSVSGKYFIIDAGKFIEDINNINENLHEIETEIGENYDILSLLINNIKTKLDNVIVSEGLNNDGTYVKILGDNLLKDAINSSDADKILSKAIQDLIKGLDNGSIITSPKISQKVNNLIYNEIDKGIFASVDLNYDQLKGALIFSRAGYDDKEIHIDIDDLFEDAGYDSLTEEIWITFVTGAGQVKEIRIPVGSLIDEWQPAINSDKIIIQEESAIILKKVRDTTSGKDLLYSDIKIDDNHGQNILKKSQNGFLYVSGNANDLFYDNTNKTIKSKIDEIVLNIVTVLAEAKVYSDTKVIEVKTYSDSQDVINLHNAKDYTDINIIDLKAYADNGRNNAIIHSDNNLTEAKAYSDTKLIEAKTYSDSQDVINLHNAKDYTDINIIDLKAYADNGRNNAIIHSDNNLTEAKAYSDTKLIEAKTYADTKDAATLTTAKTYSDTKDAATLTTAKDYADSQDTIIKAYADTKDAATLTTAKDYADSQDTIIKAYADTKDAATLTTAKDYADTKDVIVLTTAKSYSDTKLSESKTYSDTTLTTAKTYSDTTLTTAKDYADTKDVIVLTTAKAYSDSQVDNVLTTAKTYSDNKNLSTLTEAKDYADTKDAATLTTAKAYSDSQDTIIKTYADSKDVVTLTTAKDYADTKDVIVLTTAKSYSDNKNLSTLTESKDYSDSKLITEINNRINGDNILKAEVDILKTKTNISVNTNSVNTNITTIDNISTFKSDVKLSNAGGNIIDIVSDGLFISAQLDYNTANGKLKLITSNGLMSEVDISINGLIENAKYDSATRSIIISFKLSNGLTEIITIDLAELVQEWGIDNTILDNNGKLPAIILKKTQESAGGQDKLSADIVRLDTPDNILIKENNGALYVKGTASNIKYENSLTSEFIKHEDVQNALTDLDSALNVVSEMIDDDRVNFTNILSDINSLKTRTSTNENNIISINTNLSSLDGRITTLENKIGNIENSLTTINNSITSLNTKTSDLTSDLTSYKHQNDIDIININNKLTSSSGDVENIKKGVVIGGLVTDTGNTLELNKQDGSKITINTSELNKNTYVNSMVLNGSILTIGRNDGQTISVDFENLNINGGNF